MHILLKVLKLAAAIFAFTAPCFHRVHVQNSLSLLFALNVCAKGFLHVLQSYKNIQYLLQL